MKISIKVITNSKTSGIKEQADKSLKVQLKAKPIKGEANEELIKLLAVYFKIPKLNVEIIKGLRGKNKIVEIRE